MSKTQKTTFWNFLKNNSIEIPIIQRDYAQGRKGKEELRKRFIADMKSAISEQGQALVLDFVYGSVENNALNPLDGQQRLTTLWLLHWYLAYRTGRLDEEIGNQSARSLLKRFTYETRVSSREFIENLCDYNGPIVSKELTSELEKQNWFLSIWKQDPTIQSMLTTLSGNHEKDKKGNEVSGDGFEEAFSDTTEQELNIYWENLTKRERIYFYYLPLMDFGLSDDLYIKMNARGKALTSFENFKADLVDYIDTEKYEEHISDPTLKISYMLDTEWTNIFWNNRHNGKIDEIFYAFINRFFWNELFISQYTNGKYILDVGKGDESSTIENNNPSYKYLNDSGNPSPNDFDRKIAYSGLSPYLYSINEGGERKIPYAFFVKLSKILHNYSYFISKGGELPVCKWDTSFHFIPKYELDENNHLIEIEDNNKNKIYRITALTQVHRVAFFAVCKFFDEVEYSSNTQEQLNRWMRIVWNLISGENADERSQIRHVSAVRSAIEFIQSLDCNDVYNSLKTYKLDLLRGSDFDERCKEEIEKSRKILDSTSQDDCVKWEDRIINAENTLFFNGSIRFLFRNEKGEWDWSCFDEKLAKAKEMFNEDGLTDEFKKDAKAIRILLSYCNQWLDQIESQTRHNKYIFGYSKGIWKANILLKSIYSYPLHQLLRGKEINQELVLLDSDAYRKIAFERLVKTNLIAHYHSNSKYYVRWIYSGLSFYPSSEGVILTHSLRDSILNDLINMNTITLIHGEQIQTEPQMLFGWNIKFVYRDTVFEWYHTNVVYLLKDNIYLYNDKNKETESFQIKMDEKSTSDLINSMNRAIECLIDWEDKIL